MTPVSKLLKMNSIGTANQFLAIGWELIATNRCLFGSPNDTRQGDEYLCFTLGWPRASGEPQFPEHYDLKGVDI